MFKAEVIAASRNTHGQRIATFLITFPRFILAELNTHRMLSKNTASSRAIPFKRMVEMVKENPFIPIKWLKDHAGMQGVEYVGDKVAGEAEAVWLRARDQAIYHAGNLNGYLGITKQLCNRLLEPFAWTTVLITGTEWENFFALRASPHAEIHMAHLAELMLEAYNAAEVRQLQPGEWHIPYGDHVDYGNNFFASVGTKEQLMQDLCKIATARCAQTSYTLLGDDEKPMDYPKLIALHDRLATSGHMSPFEHCARAMYVKEYRESARWEFNPKTKEFEEQSGWCGNFRGFIQYRKMFPNENQSDSRVKH